MFVTSKGGGGGGVLRELLPLKWEGRYCKWKKLSLMKLLSCSNYCNMGNISLYFISR